MTFDIDRITASKEARRRRLAALPYQEKLRLLDAMRRRDVCLRSAMTRGKAPEDRSDAPGLRPSL
jgi:hypothetical protein